VSPHSVILGGVNTSQPRAKPLPPDDRRREIIEAVIPLLLEKGSTLSTREIADAAGVAEGTVFGVFPDKESVIVEAVKVTVDPESTTNELAMISDDVPFEQQLESAASVLMERGERIGILVGVLRTMQPAGQGKPTAAHRFIVDSHAAIIAELSRLFDRREAELKVTSARAAVVFWGLVFANAHSLMEDEDKLDAAAMVDMVLHGIASQSGESVA
jgi:AcrR family transcriptional regulator